MGELSPNYQNKDQLPLFGLLYNAEAKHYEQTIGGLAIAAMTPPSGGEAQGPHEIKYAPEYVWLGVQFAAA